MKTLKITLLLLAVVLLTVSGQSSDSLNKEEKDSIQKTETKYDLLVHNKKKFIIPNNG